MLIQWKSLAGGVWSDRRCGLATGDKVTVSVCNDYSSHCTVLARQIRKKRHDGRLVVLCVNRCSECRSSNADQAINNFVAATQLASARYRALVAVARDALRPR